MKLVSIEHRMFTWSKETVKTKHEVGISIHTFNQAWLISISALSIQEPSGQNDFLLEPWADDKQNIEQNIGEPRTRCRNPGGNAKSC